MLNLKATFLQAPLNEKDTGAWKAGGQDAFLGQILTQWTGTKLVLFYHGSKILTAVDEVSTDQPDEEV